MVEYPPTPDGKWGFDSPIPLYYYKKLYMLSLPQYIKEKYGCTVKEISVKHWLKYITLYQRRYAWRSYNDLLLPSQGRWWARITKHHFRYKYQWQKCSHNTYVQRVNKGRTPEQAVNPLQGAR